MYYKILFLIVILFAVVIIAPARRDLAKRKNTIDYIAEYNRVTKPDNFDPNNNAAPFYQKAFDTYVEIPEALKNKDRHVSLKRFNDDEIGVLRKWLSENANCISSFNQAVVKPYWWVGTRADSNSVDEIEFLEITSYRKVLYAAAWRAKLDAYDGKYEEAFDQLSNIYLSASQLTPPKVILEQLVGLASRAIVIRTALAIIDEDAVPVDILKSFKQQLKIHMATQKTMLELSTSDLIYTLNEIQKCFTDNGNENGKLIPSAFAKMTKDQKQIDGTSLRVSYPKALLISITHPDKKDTVELAEKYCDYFNQLIKQTPWQLNQAKTTYAESLSVFTKGNYLLNFDSGKTEGMVCGSQHNHNAYKGALFCTISIIEYKEQEAKFPEKIEELIDKGFIDSLPMDPYSDKSLVYKKAGDDFILYSIGANFKDDGGVHSEYWGANQEGGDYVFWPVQNNE
ncbi:MAG: hypothetical protein LLF92_09920 [Planctomycetaceae bacterium]|nr:hypothetical protein [Planctomycetaceae bacterium]